MIHRPGGSSHHTPAYIPGKTLHSVPENGQPSVRLSSQKKTASLRASGAQTERLFFSAEGPGCFTGRPWGCVFLRTRSVSGTCRLRLPSSPHSRRRQAGRRLEPLLKASAADRLPPWPCHPSGRPTACRARKRRTRSGR